MRNSNVAFQKIDQNYLIVEKLPVISLVSLSSVDFFKKFLRAFLMKFLRRCDKTTFLKS